MTGVHRVRQTLRSPRGAVSEDLRRSIASHPANAADTGAATAAASVDASRSSTRPHKEKHE